MKQIIDGMLYDTEKSEEIYFDEENQRRWYKTHNNRFFIAFMNGTITPVSEEVTKTMLGKKDIDKYVDIWGEPQEG